MSSVIIYTDGACRGNPGPGGWGAILISGDQRKEINGFDEHTTNNRMELSAAIESLKALKKSCTIDLYTDSKYVQQGIGSWLANWKKNNWRTAAKKPVKNQELWQALDEQAQRHTITWHWVKGHADNVENERADALANIAIDEQEKQQEA